MTRCAFVQCAGGTPVHWGQCKILKLDIQSALEFLRLPILEVGLKESQVKVKGSCTLLILPCSVLMNDLNSGVVLGLLLVLWCCTYPEALSSSFVLIIFHQPSNVLLPSQFSIPLHSSIHFSSSSGNTKAKAEDGLIKSRKSKNPQFWKESQKGIKLEGH